LESLGFELHDYLFVASLLQKIMEISWKTPSMSMVYIAMFLLSATGAALATHATHEVPGHLGDSRVVL